MKHCVVSPPKVGGDAVTSISVCLFTRLLKISVFLCLSGSLSLFYQKVINGFFKKFHDTH